MKPNTCLVVDVWEGSLDIDEAVFKTAGIAGFGIRLNDMNGGHHMDENFVRQWVEAASFVRFPYFVYNPWVSGQANYNWLAANMPTDAKAVALDIEVIYSGISPANYAAEVVKLLALCKARGWKTIIYTAQWFLPYLSTWSPSVDYWWAQYPDKAFYFGGVKTWEGLKLALDKLDKPFNAAACPGPIKMWQCNGDYLTLPGTLRPIDINIFYGTESELAAYFGAPVVTPPDDDVVRVTSVTMGGVKIPYVIDVAGTVNAKGWTYTIDQRPPVVPPSSTNLYSVTIANWQKYYGLDKPRDGGPYTMICTRATSTGVIKAGDNMNLLSIPWQNYIKKWNTVRAWEKISAPDVGPSKGFNAVGGLRYLGLIYPGVNVVNVLELRQGSDGQTWARIESIDMGAIPGAAVNPTDTPWLFHHVPLGSEDAICPIMGGAWWTPLAALTKVV